MATLRAHIRATGVLGAPKKDKDGKPPLETAIFPEKRIVIGVAILFVTVAFLLRVIDGDRVIDVPMEFDPSSPVPNTWRRQQIFSQWMKANGRTDKRNLVLTGEATLVDIIIPSDAFSGSSYKVTGIFCHVDFYLHKKDPSSVPMFRDLLGKSMHCINGRFELDLNSVVEDARSYDAAANDDASVVHTLSPTGFVFHESRCGSTLVANSLMAMDPAKNRVYSESGPPITAAKAAVSGEKGIKLLRDVVFVMGRSNVPSERRLFFKIQSIGTKSIGVFRKAFPETPFIFVFREPLEVMRSHIKVKGKGNANCLRMKRRPPDDLRNLVLQHGAEIHSLPNEDFCAAHLATLCQSALNEYKASPPSTVRMVNYKDLPEILMDDIIPNHFLKEGPLDREARDRIESVSKKYSKGRFQSKIWEADSETKQISAWEEIRSASAKYLQPLYDELVLAAAEGDRHDAT